MKRSQGHQFVLHYCCLLWAERPWMLNCSESMMGWRGAGFKAEMPQHFMRSWWPLGSSSPAAFLICVHPGGSGTCLMVSPTPGLARPPPLSLWGLQAAPHGPRLRCVGVVQPRSRCGAFKAKSWCPGEEPNSPAQLGANLTLNYMD